MIEKTIYIQTNQPGGWPVRQCGRCSRWMWRENMIATCIDGVVVSRRIVCDRCAAELAHGDQVRQEEAL